jgi:hypothetical protein
MRFLVSGAEQKKKKKKKKENLRNGGRMNLDEGRDAIDQTDSDTQGLFYAPIYWGKVTYTGKSTRTAVNPFILGYCVS